MHSAAITTALYLSAHHHAQLGEAWPIIEEAPNLIRVGLGTLALVIVCGLGLIFTLIDALASLIPNIWPLNQLHVVTTAFKNLLWNSVGWLWSHATPFPAIFGWVAWLWAHIIAPIVGLIGDVASAIGRIITHTIPDAIKWAVSQLWLGFQAVVGLIWIAIAALKDFVISFVQQVVAWAYAQLVALVHNTEAAIVSTVQTEINGVSGELHAFENAADNVLGNLTHAVTYLYTVAVPSIQHDIAGLQAFASAIDSKITNVVQPAVAAAEAVGVQALSKIEDYLRKCGNNLCSNLSEVANIMSALGDLVTAALILELIDELRHHPDVVARDIHDVFVGPVTGVLDALGMPSRAA